MEAIPVQRDCAGVELHRWLVRDALGRLLELVPDAPGRVLELVPVAPGVGRHACQPLTGVPFLCPLSQASGRSRWQEDELSSRLLIKVGEEKPPGVDMDPWPGSPCTKDFQACHCITPICCSATPAAGA